MIVFNFGPFSKDELTVTLDPAGAELLRSKIFELLADPSHDQFADCLHCTERVFHDARIAFRMEEIDSVNLASNKLLLCLSRDALTYAQDQLTEFLGKGYFSPAEFWSCQRSGRKYATQILFAKFNSLNDMIFSARD